MTLFGWRLVRIRGRSMEPMLRPGCFALFRPASRVVPGDIVLVNHPEFGLIVKRVARVFGGQCWLTGLSDQSTTMERLGTVGLERVLGRFVLMLSGK